MTELEAKIADLRRQRERPLGKVHAADLDRIIADLVRIWRKQGGKLKLCT